MRLVAFAFILIAYSMPCLGSTIASKKSSTTRSKFSINKSALESFRMNSTSVREPTSTHVGFEFGGSFGLTYLNRLNTSNEYFETNFTDGDRTSQLLGLSVGQRFYRVKYVDLVGVAHGGYSMSQGSYTATSTAGPRLQDSMIVQWMPLYATTRADFKLRWKSITPTSQIGIGTNWVRQSGVLDGSDQTAWIPMIVLGSGISLFRPTDSMDNFGGIDLGFDYFLGTSSVHDLDLVQIKVGSSFRL